MVPGNSEGTEASQLFLRLPGNISGVHPCRNLEAYFILEKIPPFPSSQGQVQNSNCKARIGSTEKQPGWLGGHINCMNPDPCHSAPSKAGSHLPFPDRLPRVEWALRNVGHMNEKRKRQGRES